MPAVRLFLEHECADVAAVLALVLASGFLDSDGFCGSQKMLKENSIRRGSEGMHSSEDWLHNSMISAPDEALLTVTTENIRTNTFLYDGHSIYYTYELQ
jgi:hypothetical protein